ncbi:hypothetical protein K438DRAFT_1769148 [Mycena galopus ATCC 62051]|nr:hypothetical protein K438DRAFT_1769148 [Mycena galopus ATCC 62051]
MWIEQVPSRLSSSLLFGAIAVQAVIQAAIGMGRLLSAGSMWLVECDPHEMRDVLLLTACDTKNGQFKLFTCGTEDMRLLGRAQLWIGNGFPDDVQAGLKLGADVYDNCDIPLDIIPAHLVSGESGVTANFCWCKWGNHSVRRHRGL